MTAKKLLFTRPQIGALMLSSSWAFLGAYRGVKDYNSREYNKVPNTDPYLYSTAIIHAGDKFIFGGMSGFFTYLNPFFIFMTLPKELYRLEVCVRGLESEKETQKYKRML